MPENLTDDGWVTLQVPVPPELVAIGVAPDLQRFFDAMIYKLRRNAHKGRWEEVGMDKAMSALCGEAEELILATAAGSTSEVLMEAADVANQALIVAAIALEAKDSAARPAQARPPAVDRREETVGELSTRDGIIRQLAVEQTVIGARAAGLHHRNRTR